MTALEMRKKVTDKYALIIGRNYYSQSRRNYCFKKYSNGCYYSDCSSSVCYSYKEAGISFGIYNTVGLYQQIGKKFTVVPVKISKGQITNPEVLRVGDMLLYAGSDKSRSYAGYVGHVEMYWGEDANGVRYLVGHGSGRPKKTKMKSKNASRYASKTGTKIGNKGLIKVIRYIQDDGTLGVPGKIVSATKTTTSTTTTTATTATNSTKSNGVARVKAGTWNLRVGAGKEYDSIDTVVGGETVEIISRLTNTKGWMFVKILGVSGYISENAVEEV